MVANAAHGKPILVGAAVWAALALAGTAHAQSTGAVEPSPSTYYGSAPASSLASTAAEAASQVAATTSVGDEPSSLPAASTDGPLDSLSGASAPWTSSPAGDGAPLAVVGGDGPTQQDHDQTSNVSANSGLNGGVSDAH